MLHLKLCGSKCTPFLAGESSDALEDSEALFCETRCPEVMLKAAPGKLQSWQWKM
jgi:hypothetical protein